MKLIKEIPTVLPIYTNIRNQNRYKENVLPNCNLPLFSPSDSFLPFLLQIPIDSPKPSSWKLFNQRNEELIDLSNNIDLLKAFNFSDFTFAYYKGEKLTFEFETISEDLNLCGNNYFVLTIAGIEYFSEVFTMSSEITTSGFSNKFIKINFWDDSDIEPIRYRNGFKQTIYLDTFIHESEPQIEEENEADGLGNSVPTFQKLVIKQKIETVVPDFLKNALHTMELHENIELFDQNKRTGSVDRLKVSSTSEEFGSQFTVSLNFETDILFKTACEKNKSIVYEIWI